ncbi:hypothetical protein CEXT_553741 [Caerostris extrusa]|uniref:Uncharacterized protein n=1 Tax=Caerostris extrusa TaxID=172846 RepID=A0AAV4PUC0_CAEEX|nr:hypothetical protein CEXT_553741 [Caerostris extrusa]
MGTYISSPRCTFRLRTEGKSSWGFGSRSGKDGVLPKRGSPLLCSETKCFVNLCCGRCTDLIGFKTTVNTKREFSLKPTILQTTLQAEENGEALSELRHQSEIVTRLLIEG